MLFWSKAMGAVKGQAAAAVTAAAACAGHGAGSEAGARRATAPGWKLLPALRQREGMR